MTTQSDDSIKKHYQLVDRITAGITQSSTSAVVSAIKNNSTLILWKDGRIVEVDPRTIDIDNKPEKN